MAVYDGVPSIRLEGDGERALALIPEAKALLYKVQTFKQRAGVGTFSMSRRVDDDSTIYVLSSLDQNLIHISVAPDVPEQVYPEDESLYYSTLSPDFYSGLVYNGYLEERVREDDDGNEVRYSVCVSFSPTPNCRFIHKELSGGRQEVPRLAVRPWAAFDELNNGSPSGRSTFTQYAKLRSSMYSGTMKKVAQIAMGLGRIGKAKLRDSRAVKPDTGYIKDVEANGVQIRYDWRFIRTHGITTGADGRLWIVEISSARGVIARPLPIFPRSMTEDFRERAEARGDSAMTTALDELGCLPTGEAFPNTAAQVNELIERGEILRLLEPSDLSEFYHCSAYSSAMGWAFNERGNEAHNTAYYFGDDGFQRGVWYQVNINIGAIKEDREPGEPIANGSANLRKNAEGYIYCPPAPPRARYAPIKFYEPMLPGLLSHEGAPDSVAASLPVPKVDTPMFVSFINNDLHVVRYYRNPTTRETSVKDTRPPNGCMFDGDWEYIVRTGPEYIPPMMYSNMQDFREPIPQAVNASRWISIPGTWTDYSAVSVDRFRSVFTRFRRFDETYTNEVSDSYRLGTVCAVPQFSREAYYLSYGKERNISSGTTRVGEALLQDVNYYVGHHYGIDENVPPIPPSVVAHAGVPGAPVDNPNRYMDYITTHALSPDPCAAEAANAGSWLNLLDYKEVILRSFPVREPVISFPEFGTVADTDLTLNSPGYGGPLAIPLTASQFFDHWMIPSPDPVTRAVQFIYAEHSAIGNDMLVYATNLSSYQGEKRTYGYAPDTIGPNDGYPAFVGVNKP